MAGKQQCYEDSKITYSVCHHCFAYFLDFFWTLELEEFLEVEARF